ncbi:unnamed protein product [Brassica oleracea var. botrytis]
MWGEANVRSSKRGQNKIIVIGARYSIKWFEYRGGKKVDDVLSL